MEDKEDDEVEEETPFPFSPPNPVDASLPSESVGDKNFLDGTPDPRGRRKLGEFVDNPGESGDESIDSHQHKNTKNSSSRAGARGPGQFGRDNSQFN